MILGYQRDSKRMLRVVFSTLFILATPVALFSLLSCRVTVQGEPCGPEEDRLIYQEWRGMGLRCI